MLPERLPPDDPREWINRAYSNLIQANIERQGIYLEDLCFQAQQAAEKALKALLLHLNVDFPYTHSLAVLISLLEQAGYQVPDRIRESAKLTDYAVAARYPGLDDIVEWEEYLEALDLADAVVRWADESIS